jgi:PAS domain S-box-containing protein
MLLRDLFFNLAILLAISVLSGFIDLRFNRSGLPGKIMQGVLFGLACVVGMIYPFVLTEGIIFDGRSIIISLVSLFFGPLSGIISASIAIFYRIIIIGGAGSTMGLAVIITSMGTGLAFHYWLKAKPTRRLSVGNLYMFGMLVHIIMLLDMMFLPNDYISEALTVIGFAVIIVYPAGSMIIGKILLDQAENKLLIEEILDNEELYRTTLYSVSEAIITTDKLSRILQMNPVAETLTGWTEKDAIQIEIDHVFSLIEESNHEAVQDAVKQVIKTGDQFESEENLLLKTRSGEEIPVSFRCTRRLNSNGSVIGTVIILRDLRIERQRKLALIRSAESYQGLFNSVTGAIYIQDREARFLDVNKGAEAMYGYNREEFIGKTPEFLGAPGKNNLKLILSYIEAAFNGKPQHFEFWGKRKNGDVFPKEVNIYKTLFDGNEAIIAFAQDITERKLSQLELAESEERYRTLFNSAPVGILLIDKHGTIINANETLCKQYGFQKTELLGNNVDIIVSEENKPLVKENIKKIFQNNILLSRINAYTKSGEPKVFELIESVVTLPNGEKGVLSISSDITEQVSADKIIRESEARNKAIISAIPDLFFRFDKDGYFIDIVVDDPSKLFIPKEQALGRHCSEILPPGLSELTLKAIETALSTGEIVRYEYELNMNGSLQWFEARVAMSGTNEVLAIIRDISERHHADEALKSKSQFIETLLDSLPNPLFYMDNNGKYLGINKAFREYYQVKNKDFVGKSLFEIDSIDTAVTYAAADKLIFDGIEAKQTFDQTIVLPNGEERNVIITKSPFPDANNNIGGLIGMIVDITQRKKLEDDLIVAKDRAEESDHLKTSFLNNLSHEIRTPLNAIVGFSDLLNADYPDDQKAGFIEIINNNSNQLLHIIDDVLAVSRLESEKIPIDNETFSLKELFDDLYNTFDSQAAISKLVLLQPELSSVLPETIYHDKGKIRQVMAGFIENAIKYTTEGNISMECTMLDNALKFSVKDTGMGVDPREQEYVFDRFYRTNEVQLKAIRGNGLGLSIAKSLVELIGGTIGLESVSGIGSAFYFVIPIQNNLQNEIPFAKKVKSANVDISGFNVLIVEDEIDNYNYLVSVLRSRVNSILRAISGDEAIRLADLFPFHLVLMDLKIPVINGTEATKIIRSRHPNLPVIAISAHTEQSEIRKALEAGCDAYVTKPISKENLFKAINAV